MIMYRMVLAGFGGQGVLSMGQFMAHSGLLEGKEVSYLPAYGPEMRGGTANCSVVISEKPVSSPLCTNPDILVAMNTPSLIKFMGKVRSGGTIFVNSSLVDVEVDRKDVTVIKIPANDLALKAGTVKAANMVMTGALFQVIKPVKDESIDLCIKEKFGFKQSLLEVNEKAYGYGKECAKQYVK